MTASALRLRLRTVCASLERKNLNMTQSRIFTRSDPPEDYVKASPKLSFINAGAGGTGIRDLRGHVQPLQLLSWHSWHCGSRKLDDVAILFGQVHGFGVRNNAMVTRTSRIKAEAVLRNRQAGKMQSRDVKLLLNRYYKERLMELSQGFFVTDTPVAEVFHELLLLAKEQAGVMMTLREASEWTERRIAQFSDTWMCRRELWDDPNVLHPFDYLGCFIAAKHGFSPNKAFTSMIDHAIGAPPLKYVGLPVTEKLKERFNSTLIKEIEQAYVQMNTVNWLLAQKMEARDASVSMGSPFQQSSEQEALHGQAARNTGAAHTALSRSEQDQDNARRPETVKITESVPSWQAQRKVNNL